MMIADRFGLNGAIETEVSDLANEGLYQSGRRQGWDGVIFSSRQQNLVSPERTHLCV